MAFRIPHAAARRMLLSLLGACAVLTSLQPAVAAPDFPAAKAIRIVVPYAPGGTADILAREMAQRLAPVIGQTVVVENKAGAGTAIGARHVAGSPADGYTLFMGTVTSHAINPALQPQIGYDPVKDFTALAAIGEVPYAIVTHPSKNIRTLDELIALGRTSSRPLSYSSAGLGSSNHLGGALLGEMTRLNFIHVPYKGSAPALNDLLAGQVDFMFDLVTTAQSHIRAGKLVALATTSQQRAAVLPQVPTSAEAGLPRLTVTSWFGLFAPSGLPADVNRKLDTALADVLSRAETRDRLKSLGLNLMNQRGAEFGKIVQQDFAYWSGAIEKTHIKVDF